MLLSPNGKDSIMTNLLSLSPQFAKIAESTESLDAATWVPSVCENIANRMGLTVSQLVWKALNNDKILKFIVNTCGEIASKKGGIYSATDESPRDRMIRERKESKSEGHIKFSNEFEYFVYNGSVYRAERKNPLRIDVPVRNGARFYARYL